MNAISERTKAPVWASRWLGAAGIYNCCGVQRRLRSHFLFDVSGIDRINYPEIWQCVGMIVGVYGIGYLIAAGDSPNALAIVLVGLLGKVFGPIGVRSGTAAGHFHPLFGLTILTNDLLWWIPFDDPAGCSEAPQSDIAADGNCVSSSLSRPKIKASPDVVFHFHESPDAAPYPPWENMKLVESAGSLQPGSRVVLRGSLGIIPIQVGRNSPNMIRHASLRGPSGSQVRSPKRYHRHRFLDDGQGGTLLRDEVEYAVPIELIGQLSRRLACSPQTGSHDPPTAIRRRRELDRVRGMDGVR